MNKNSKKAKARELHKSVWGGRVSDEKETSGDYAGYKNVKLPKTHTEMRTITAHLNAFLEVIHKNPPKGVSLLHLNTIKKLYEIAMRNNVDKIETIVCPECGETHAILCDGCGKPVTFDMPNVQQEKNSVTCLLKLSDKIAPNLAAVTQDINVNFLVNNISDFVARTIVRYVPESDKQIVMGEFTRVMTNIAEGDQ